MSDVEFSGAFFLDTNVLVYSFDRTAPEKQQVAKQLVSLALATQRGNISTQVVQEFLNVSLRKFAQPLSVSEARSYLNAVLLPLCRHFPTLAFYDQALLIREETGYSLYDSLIVTAALATESSLLFSEDLQHGHRVRGLEIINPFRD